MKTSNANIDVTHRSNSRRRQSSSEIYHIPSTGKDKRRQSWLTHLNNNNGYSSPAGLVPEDQILPRSARSLRVPRTDEPESVGSTTAPSTVWDDLDELKSRVRHLEGSGKPQQTSNIATSNGSGDRPRTATTSGTTISSSPRQNRKPSIMPAETFGSSGCANMHPLLHSALFKAKGVLSPTIYRALESSGIDALELAAITGSNIKSSATPLTGAPGAQDISAPSSFSERHLRRKTDGLCRGLTELCIALCEARNMLDSPSSTLARSSRDVQADHTTGSTGAVPLHASEPISAAASMKKRIMSLGDNRLPDSPSRISPSRALNRVEARRSSLAALSGQNAIASNGTNSVSRLARRTTIDVNSPITLRNQHRNQNCHNAINNISHTSANRISNNRSTPSRLSRSNTSLLLRRRQTSAGVNNDSDSHLAVSTDDEEIPKSNSQQQQRKLLRHRHDLRAPSRALTEIGRFRPQEGDREQDGDRESRSSDARSKKDNIILNNNGRNRSSRASLTSRAYTSQHPLPDQSASSPLAQSFISSHYGPNVDKDQDDNCDNGIDTGASNNYSSNTGPTKSSLSSSASSLLRSNNSSSQRYFDQADQVSPSAPANSSHDNPSHNSISGKSSQNPALSISSADEWRQKLALLGSGSSSKKTGSLAAKSVVSVAGGGRGSRSTFSRLAGGKGVSKAASIAG